MDDANAPAADGLMDEVDVVIIVVVGVEDVVREGGGPSINVSRVSGSGIRAPARLKSSVGSLGMGPSLVGAGGGVGIGTVD